MMMTWPSFLTRIEFTFSPSHLPTPRYRPNWSIMQVLDRRLECGKACDGGIDGHDVEGEGGGQA